jgi:hypothetical protein
MIDSSGNMRLCYEMGVIGNILKKDPRNYGVVKKHYNIENKFTMPKTMQIITLQ